MEALSRRHVLVYGFILKQIQGSTDYYAWALISSKGFEEIAVVALLHCERKLRESANLTANVILPLNEQNL